MKRFRDYRLISFFFVFAYLFIAVGVSEGMVLCVGSNGHLAFEAVHPENNIQTAFYMSGYIGSKAVFTEKERHNVCVDIPVFAAPSDVFTISFNLSNSSPQQFLPVLRRKNILQSLVRLNLSSAQNINYSHLSILQNTVLQI